MSIELKVDKAKGLRSTEWFSRQDPYVSISCADNKKIKTKVKEDENDNPEWNEQFKLQFSNSIDKITFKVYNYNNLSDDYLIGTAALEMNMVTQPGVWQNFVLDLKYEKEKAGKLYVSIKVNNNTSSLANNSMGTGGGLGSTSMNLGTGMGTGMQGPMSGPYTNPNQFSMGQPQLQHMGNQMLGNVMQHQMGGMHMMGQPMGSQYGMGGPQGGMYPQTQGQMGMGMGMQPNPYGQPMGQQPMGQQPMGQVGPYGNQPMGMGQGQMGQYGGMGQQQMGQQQMGMQPQYGNGMMGQGQGYNNPNMPYVDPNNVKLKDELAEDDDLDAWKNK